VARHSHWGYYRFAPLLKMSQLAPKADEHRSLNARVLKYAYLWIKLADSHTQLPIMMACLHK
jgi:hypothetical protein